MKKKKELADYVLTIPDFPKEGILFRDISTVLADADGFKLAIDAMTALVRDLEFDAIAGLEARGFIFGAALAYKLHKPLVMIRKKGKLPREAVSTTYDLEYGHAEIEIHKDDLKPGQKVVLVDDLLATGGTMEAAAKLVEMLDAEVVKMIFLIELTDLGGRERLEKYELGAALTYSNE